MTEDASYNEQGGSESEEGSSDYEEVGGGKRKISGGRGQRRGSGKGRGRGVERGGGGGGTRESVQKKAKSGGGDHTSGGDDGGNGYPPPQYPPCPRNGINWVAQLASERAWEKADRVAILKTGGVDGLVGMMGTGSNCGGAASWEGRVDSWIAGIKERSADSQDSFSTVVSLVKACEEADQSGIVADFMIMLRHIHLFLKLYRSVCICFSGHFSISEQK